MIFDRNMAKFWIVFFVVFIIPLGVCVILLLERKPCDGIPKKKLEAALLDNIVKNNREFILCALSAEGSLLESCNEELKDDDEAVLSAIESFPPAFFHASKRLRCNKKIALEAVYRDPEMLIYTCPKIQNDTNFLLLSIEYAKLNEKNVWDCDKRFSELKFADVSVQNNLEFLKKVVTKYPGAYVYLNSGMKDDHELRDEFISLNGMVFTYLNEEEKKDENVMILALESIYFSEFYYRFYLIFQYSGNYSPKICYFLSDIFFMCFGIAFPMISHVSRLLLFPQYLFLGLFFTGDFLVMQIFVFTLVVGTVLAFIFCMFRITDKSFLFLMDILMGEKSLRDIPFFLSLYNHVYNNRYSVQKMFETTRINVPVHDGYDGKSIFTYQNF